MTEQLLHFIWRFQHFQSPILYTIQGESLRIIHPGFHNTNQGPDFLNAKIKVGDTTWAGSVELHIRSSDWVLHGHSTDTNYSNVILHVVWIDDIPLKLPFPVLELQSIVPKLLLSKYALLMERPGFIPCEKQLNKIQTFSWDKWKEELLVTRLENKTEQIRQYLLQNKQHWEETFWWLLARNFGTRINCDAFELVARSVPVHLLSKHRHQIHQTEALLLGQAGLLQGDFEDDYPRLLKKEFHFLKSKYQLKPIAIPVHFLRMRPSNFPTIRLAQLAMLVHRSQHLFSYFKSCTNIREMMESLEVTANDYWHYHYTFDQSSSYFEKHLGKQMIQTILINTVFPIVFAYGHIHQESDYVSKAMRWYEEIEGEHNSITAGFKQLGIHCKNAFESQALIELKTNYCDHKKCLNCAIGYQLIHNRINPPNDI